MVALHTTGQVNHSVRDILIGVFDHVGGGFIGRELNIVNILFAKSALARNHPHKLADFIQKFKFCGESNRFHMTNLKPPPPWKAEGGIYPFLEFEAPHSAEGPLKMSHCHQGVIKGFEKLGKAGQFKRFTNTFGYIREDNLTTVVAPAISLGCQ